MNLSYNFYQKNKDVERFAFLFFLKKWIWRILFLSAFIQMLFFYSASNLFAVAAVLICWVLTEQFVLVKINLCEFTFSTVVIFGFFITQFFFPIVFTLVESKPVIFNLSYPYSTFIHLSLSLISLILSQSLYKKFFGRKGKLNNVYGIRKYLIRFGLFRVPKDREVWLIGFIGLSGMIVNLITKSGTDGDGVVNKVLSALFIFSYSPFLLLVKPLYKTKDFEVSRKQRIFLFFYAIGIISIGIMSNSRGVFMNGALSIGIAYSVGLLIGKFNYKIMTLRNVILIGLLAWILTGPLADLGLSMLVVRETRNETSPTELLSKTLEVYSDKDDLKKYEDIILDNHTDWDERYLDNIFLSRFSNLKLVDINLEQAFKTGKQNAEMNDYSWDRFWAILPQPVIDFFQIKVNKEKTISTSFGDYLYYTATGNSYALGGFRTGNFIGTGMSAFGWYYLMLLIIVCIPFFFLIDIFLLVQEQYRFPNINFAGLLIIGSLFTFFGNSSNSESIINVFSFLFRGWLQLVLLYLIVFLIAKLLNNLANKGR